MSLHILYFNSMRMKMNGEKKLSVKQLEWKKKTVPIFFLISKLIVDAMNCQWVLSFQRYIYMYEYDVYMYTWIYNLNGMHRT